MIYVATGGLLTSVQDLGRYGFQRYGVIVSGAMDQFALRMGNLLVRNDENAPVLEMTLVGPKLKFETDSLIAITGKGMAPRIDGEAVPTWRQLFVRAGATLDFQPLKGGCRLYLAVAGGIRVPEVMGSASTYLRAGIGGFEGRALAQGDRLPLGKPGRAALRDLNALRDASHNHNFAAAKWFPNSDMFPWYQQNPVIRVVPGNQMPLFSDESRENFFKAPFQVTPQSDRMGYRLHGPHLQLSSPHELISEAVTAGTIQVPHNGNPIVLMADRQTTGGYPKIAQVATVDLPVLAQVKPGELIRFELITVGDAQQLLREQERQLCKFGRGVKAFSS